MNLSELIARYSELGKIDPLDIVEAKGKPVAYWPKLAHVFGGVSEGVLLSQFMYWHGKESSVDGFIFKTIPDITSETGLSKCEQQTARNTFKALGVLEEKKKGSPPKNYFKFDWGAIVALVLQWDGNGPLKQRAGNGPSKGGKWSNDGPKTAQLYKVSESTTENTAESTKIPPQRESSINQPAGSQEGKSRKGKEGNRKDVPPPPEEAVAVVQLLLDAINGIKDRIPPNRHTTDKWLAEVTRMHDVDGIGWEALEKTMNYAQDGWWKGKVLTIPAFSKHWNTLQSQMEAPKEGGARGKRSWGTDKYQGMRDLVESGWLDK